MSRYMMKYKGKYRLKVPYDLKTLDFPRTKDGNIDPNYDDIYIDCHFGSQVFHYGYTTLCAYIPSIGRGNNIVKAINKIDPSIITSKQITDEEILIYFKDKNLEKIIHLFKPRTNGAEISPFSIRNLPRKIKKFKPYEIQNAKLLKFKDILKSYWKNIDKSVYLSLYKYLIKETGKEFYGQKYKAFDMIEVNGAIDLAIRWLENLKQSSRKRG